MEPVQPNTRLEPITARQTGEFARLLQNKGIGKDEFQSIFIDGISNLTRWIDSLKPPESSERPEIAKMIFVDRFPLAVTYGELERRIEAGRYNYVQWGINVKKFPIERIGEAQLEALLVGFDSKVTGEEVIEALDRLDLRAGTVEELVAFGKKYPKWQKEYLIAALGSVVTTDGSLFVPVTKVDKTGCCLVLYEFKEQKGFEWRFLAFRI